MRIAIIGGGISGLATAHYVCRARPDWSVELYEANAYLGGTLRTETVDGFHFECGGNGFLTNKPDTLALVQATGGDHLLLRSNDAARQRFIFNGRLHRLPDSPATFLRSRLLTLPQKLRVAAEVLIPRKTGDDDESLRDFGTRRLGKGFTDALLDPMAAGVFGATAEGLSVNAAFPAVVRLEAEHGGLFKGMIKQRRRQAGPAGVLTSFTGGVGTLIDHLRERLPVRLHLAEPVRALRREAHGGYQVTSDNRSAHYDHVVLCTPSYIAAHLLLPVDKALSEAVDAIDYTPISVVGFGWQALNHTLDGFGLLTTQSAGQRILGVLWDSSVFTDRAPAGQRCVRVMIGGQRQPDLALRTTDELIAIARQGLRATMGITQAPDTVFVKSWPRGIPNYRVGHLGRVATIDRLLSDHPRLSLNANAYRGIGINDCVANSRITATAITG